MDRETLMLIGCAGLCCAGLALNAWVLIARLRERSPDRIEMWRNWTKRIALDAFRELLRDKLLAGGYGKHRAYHVSKDGILLAVDAADMQLANLTELHEFWDIVASAGDERGNPFAVSLDEIDLGDGKGDFTYVCNHCGKAFVDGAAPLPSSDANPCARATANDFKHAVVHAQAEAAERKRSRYANAFHERWIIPNGKRTRRD